MKFVNCKLEISAPEDARISGVMVNGGRKVNAKRKIVNKKGLVDGKRSTVDSFLGGSR